MINHTFKYEYLQFVKITVFGLDCDGRVVRQIADGTDKIYDVQYAINGELR